METSSPSPSYNVHGPRPWTSFKDTPPSPLLVLRRKEGAKYRAPPAPVSLQEELSPRRSSKRRAPAPPVRSSSLKDSEDEQEEKQINVTKIEASPRVTIDLEEAANSSQSFKNEVSIFVFPDNKTKEFESKLHGEDSQDGVCGSEIILDVSQLQNSLDDALENFGNAVIDMREEKNNVKLNEHEEKETNEKNHERGEFTTQSNLTTHSPKKGRKLTIEGWEKFVEGIVSVKVSVC